MNDRQKRFAEEYAANGGNATKAAQAAGYSAKTARQQGQRLLTIVDIADYLGELQSPAQDQRIADIQEVKSFWSDIMRSGAEKVENRLKASELLAKSGGAFIQKIEADISAEVDAAVEGQVVFYLPDNGRPVITDEEAEPMQ